MCQHARIGWKKKITWLQIQATLFAFCLGQGMVTSSSAATAQCLASTYNIHDSVIVHFTRKKKNCTIKLWYFSSECWPWMHIASWRLPTLARHGIWTWCWGQPPWVQRQLVATSWATLSSWLKTAIWTKKFWKWKCFFCCTHKMSTHHAWLPIQRLSQQGSDPEGPEGQQPREHHYLLGLLVVSGSNTWAYLGLEWGRQARHLWTHMSSRLRGVWWPGKSQVLGWQSLEHSSPYLKWYPF